MGDMCTVVQSFLNHIWKRGFTGLRTNGLCKGFERFYTWLISYVRPFVAERAVNVRRSNKLHSDEFLIREVILNYYVRNRIKHSVELVPSLSSKFRNERRYTYVHR
jgi:hypothetical protein